MLFLQVIINYIMDKDINEKTRVSLGLPSLFTIIGSTISLVIAIIVATWSIHGSLNEGKIAQQKIDSEQNSSIDKVNIKVETLDREFKDSRQEINNKLDKIIDKQDKDHDKVDEMVIRHEYLNLNKAVK